MHQLDSQLVCLSADYSAGIKKLAHSIGGKTIIGSGESTHGTHEFSLLKTDLFTELVTAHGFRVFALEDAIEECIPINTYIQTGGGNLDKLMGRLYPVWQTREIYDLILALHKLAQKREIAFVGIDIDQRIKSNLKNRDKLMADNASIATHDGKTFIWAHNEHVRKSFTDTTPKGIGYYLHKKLGEDYAALGQFFGHGTFSAKAIEDDDWNTKDRTLSPIQIGLPDDKRLVEMALHKAKCPSFYLPLSHNRKIAALDCVLYGRSIGWGVSLKHFNNNNYTWEFRPYQDYDVLVYFDKAKHTNSI